MWSRSAAGSTGSRSRTFSSAASCARGSSLAPTAPLLLQLPTQLRSHPLLTSPPFPLSLPCCCFSHSRRRRSLSLSLSSLLLLLPQ
uniref:Cesa5 n=1 Tax=Arundo donax TaxID=35708 RepID=A0A0A8XXE9_ARUDO